MLHFTGADAVGETAQGAVGGGVGIAADHRHAGQHRALLRRHHVHDALTHIADTVFGDAELAGVVLQRLHLDARGVVDDVRGVVERRGRHIVVDGRHRRAGPPRLTTRQAQPLEGLRRGHFVDDLTINVNQRGAVLAFGHEVGVPQLVVECLACHNLFSN